jgi:hypothetical protein
MATPETICRSVQLAALPTSPDEATRTASVIVATEAEIRGLILQCRAGAVVFPPGPVPLLLDHERTVGAVAGRLERFELVAGELRALAVIADAPAADTAWPLVKTGAVSVSVGAEVLELVAGADPFGPEIATRWRIREASLTPVPADPGCVIRSHNQTEETTVTIQTKPEGQAAEATPTTAELRRAADLHRQVERAVAFAPEEARPEVRRIALAEGLEAARAAAIDARHAAEQQAPGGTIRSEIDPDYRQQSQLATSIERAMAGERLAEPLWLQLRREGVPGSNAADVFRSWLQGRRDPMVSRAMHSTTDAPALLLGAGDRMLQQQFQMAAGGVLAAAEMRPLNDYRPASIIDVGKVGGAKRILEGGEIQFSTIEESNQSYKPARWGDGLSVSPEALANDDLGGLRQAIAELGAAAVDAERTELSYLLEGTANGGTAADGQPLFHSSHSNTVSTGPLSIDKLGAAVALLRGQKTVGGRHIDQQPGVILCGVAAELVVRQLLSAAVVPDTQQNVNPWADLTVEVDPRIGDTYVYLISAGPRKPLELGRLYPAPQISDTVDFNTGAYKIKAEHAFGVAVAEFRAIVRMKLAA